ncbi:MAG: AI-2E family transporter [Reyranellaceae bacterium]
MPALTESKQLRIWLIVGLIFFALLWLLRDVLMPFVAGLIIAYFLDPLVDRLERRGLGRTVGTAIVLIGFLLALFAFLLLLAPLIYDQAVGFAENLPRYLAELNMRLLPKLEALKPTLGITGTVTNEVAEAVSERGAEIFTWLSDAMGSVLAGGLALFDVIATLVLTPVVAFYVLRDWDHMVAKIDSWLPRRYAGTIRQLGHEADRSIAGYMRGQALVCLILGTFYAGSLALVGLEFGLVIGLIAGLITFIPYVGSLVGGILAIGMALAQFPPDWTSVAIVAAIFVLGQAVEGNYLSPKLVGDRVGLHAVWIMFALLAGGALFGFTGVLLAVPVAALIGVLCRFFMKHYLASRLYDDGHVPPFQVPPVVVDPEQAQSTEALASNDPPPPATSASP